MRVSLIMLDESARGITGDKFNEMRLCWDM